MIYQLSTGKIIYLTVEQYLDLTDQDLQYLVSINAGHYAPVRNPFIGASIAPDEDEEDDEESDDEYYEEVPIEDFPEIPDTPPDLDIDLE